jgi:aryl-alcohol dehydrogenase-like predicted oxidoreductase
MERRKLGTTDLEVSAVTYGTMGFDGTGSAEDGRREAILETALAAGIDTVDTAPLYGFGRSERLVGRVIARLGARPAVLTKVGLRWDDAHGEVMFRARDDDGRELVVRRDSRPESILLEVERSLERLRVDRIDLIQVHHRDRLVPLGETMGALRDVVQSGAARAVGVSNFTVAEIDEARRALGTVPLASLQSQYNLLARDVEQHELRAVRERSIGFLAYSPLAQGLLGGGYGPERKLRSDDWRASSALFSERSRAVIRAAIAGSIGPIAMEHRAGIAQIALAWLIAQPGITSVIAGASSPRHAQQNAASASLRLSVEEIERISRAFSKLPVDHDAGRLGRAWARAKRMVARSD